MKLGAVPLALGWLALAGGCGARTELQGLEICGPSDEPRACWTECGLGVQRCEERYWQPCEAPVSERACTNACGQGVEQCSDGKWQGCVVEPVFTPCENDCGVGQLSCENGVVGECEVPVIERECQSVCGFGTESCAGGSWQACTAPQPKPPKLQATIRDFDDTHPDFERPGIGGLDLGIVEPVLGADDKPVYGPHANTSTTSGKPYFDEWYNDVPGVNLSLPLSLELAPEAGDQVFFVYDDHSFFPIDGQLLGNQGRNHNFHFTLEARTTFTYVGGEIFTFSGDDDMWVFVNRRLATDLGGLRQSETASVELDEVALDFGLALGGTYPIHFFFAERHTVESNFTIRTTIAEAGSCE